MLDKAKQTDITLWDGRTIPRLGMGCWAIGGPFYAGDVPLGWGDVDDAESTRAIHRAIDLGIRFFDTASNYGAGHSEEVLGKALASHPDIVVATKFGFATDPATKQATGVFATPDFIRASLETSLQRLKRERIDLLQFHLNEFDPAEADAVFDTLDSLQSEGKIAAYGWSTDWPERAARFAGRSNFVSVQHTMNVLEPAEQMIALAEQADLISINRGPLAMGLLSGKFRLGDRLAANDVRSADFDWLQYFRDGVVSPDFWRRLDVIRDLLQTGGRTLTQGALGWLWARSPYTLPIPGFRTVRQVEENAGALEKGPLPASAMDAIDDALRRERLLPA
jgi:aryl-alcohol dehydrogenase-like predicted oxidoreductase